jgi:hypothetical protein
MACSSQLGKSMLGDTCEITDTDQVLFVPLLSYMHL